MKLFLPLLLLFISGIQPSDKFPKGCYMTFKELKAREPSEKCTLQIKKRTDASKFWWGGSDYKLYSPNDLSEYEIAFDVWAYSNDTALYINCKRAKEHAPEQDRQLPGSYSLALSRGRYITFYTYSATTKGTLGSAFGVVGIAVTGAATKNEVARDLNVIDLRESMLHWCDSAYVAKALVNYPNLLQQFKSSGTNANNDSIQIHFLQLINDQETAQDK